jgi:hypothetical protein
MVRREPGAVHDRAWSGLVEGSRVWHALERSGGSGGQVGDAHPRQKEPQKSSWPW